jgi:hypothetical protein
VGKSGRTLAKPITLSKKNSMKRKFLQTAEKSKVPARPESRITP